MSPSRQERDCRYWPIGIGWYWSILVHIDPIRLSPAASCLHASWLWQKMSGGSRSKGCFQHFCGRVFLSDNGEQRSEINGGQGLSSPGTSMYVLSMLGFIVQASSVVSRLAFVLRGIWAEVFQSSECFISIQFHRPIWVCRQDFGIWKGLPSRFQKQERVVGLSSYGDVCSLKRF